jgi:Fe-S-cluster containining protein
MIDPIHSNDSNMPLLSAEARAELRTLYDDLDAEVAKLGPICQLSGRCCHFEEYGHTLFLSNAEVQFLLEVAPEPSRALDQGKTCPWQNASGHCTAREGRPIGCRVYYCDPHYERRAHDISERFIAQLKELSDRHGLAWNYAPLHRHLNLNASYLTLLQASNTLEPFDACTGPAMHLGR